LFLIDFRLGYNNVHVDIIPDFIGWILIASALGWILELHSEIKGIRTLSYWLIFLSIFDLIEIRMPAGRAAQISCWTAPMFLIGIITLILSLIAIWRLCGVIVDMAAEVGSTLIRERADFRRRLYVGFTIAVYVAAGICYVFPPLVVPLVFIGLPLAIIVICLMMGLMKATANMCRQDSTQAGHFTGSDSLES
ncbi:MAG: hypothetical protein ACYSUC_12670, partial [Planctomycetota bacterium]|jgi:hypothetical protein